MLLSLDGTLVVQLVNFVVFLLVLNAVFIKPVSAAIASRRAHITGVGRDIEQFEADVKALHAQAAEKLAEARRAAEARIAVARAAAQSDAAGILVQHQSEAALITEQAHALVAQEIAAARVNQAALVESLARDMLVQAVGAEVAA
jgi:F-type H+-transporting ATPase subunit b